MIVKRIARIGLSVLVLAPLAGGRALAQTDFAGEWAGNLHEDIGHRFDNPNPAAAGGIHGGGGPQIGDYAGLPINDAARLKADSWDASIMTLRERQTIPGPAAYWARAGGPIRISEIIDDATQQLVALKIYRAAMGGSVTRMIWLDGRPHPPEYAAHTWEGFSTGTWEGNMLTVETTHVKAGWIQRNGVPASDQATITEHIVRHGDYMTIVSLVRDPIYLEEPLVRTTTWTLALNQQLDAVSNEIVDEIAGRSPSYVPHHLPGENRHLMEFAESVGLPFAATRGGRDTMYPEYQLLLKEWTAKAKKNSQKKDTP
jgi:hypothetical protein